MNKHFSPLHLYLNNQTDVLEDKIVSFIDPKTQCSAENQFCPFKDEHVPIIKVGNFYTVPFFKK